jgi:hypothetical protein
MYKFLKRLTIWLFVWMVFYSIIDKVKANDSIIITTGDNGTLNIVQDGINNYIDLTANDFDVGDMEIKQNGNSNSVDLNITAGTGTGSSFYIYQNGNSNTYNAELYCGAEWCTMTVNQP